MAWWASWKRGFWKIRRGLRYELHAMWRRRPIRPGTVFYESFGGNGMLDNPEAIFRELRDEPEFADFEHIWAITDKRLYRRTIAEFAHDKRVRFVTSRSVAYFRALATSQYLINNATFPTEFGKRDGQTYLNTWHGTPLKRMGYDMDDGPFEAANTLRNFLAADYLLAANPFMTEQMYKKAYRLQGIYTGTVIEEGYPRIDRQRLDEETFLLERARLETAGLRLGGRNIVLYAPTWKGTSFSRPEDDIDELLTTVQQLQNRLGRDRYVVLLKTHQSVAQYARAIPALAGVLVPNDVPTNVVLGLASMVVTDYSSIFFDFLATGRPVFFFTPDISEYSDGRGLYFAPASWPGPVCTTIESLAEQILLAADGTESPAQLGLWRDRFTAREDGEATRRVIDVVFRGARTGYRVRDLSMNEKTSLLIYLGGMRSNGITSSALNLLHSIDHEHYDVTVTFARANRGQSRQNQRHIDPRVRQLPRLGGMNGSKLVQLRRKLNDLVGTTHRHKSDAALLNMWDDEWNRVFGPSRFDHVIDFSGYSPFWSALLLHSPRATRSIWLHNDMAAEVNRVVRGRRRLKRGLLATFALYREFQALVSVSPALAELNRANLTGYAPYYRFVAARNLLDTSRVVAGARIDVRELEDYPPAVDSVTGETLLDDEGDPVRPIPDWANELAASSELRWFVTVGRFSPEKNQARLLRAFATVSREHPAARLLIVGYGPLRSTLEKQLISLGLGGKAFVVGPFMNPYALMAASDCFVLSSDYEGQPMVLLEAATLGLPIVTVAFGSAQSALPGRQLTIVEQSDDGLAQGMRAFLRGEVPASSVDIAAYNKRAVAEFSEAIGGASQSSPAREERVAKAPVADARTRTERFARSETTGSDTIG
jgi:CDP-glycerol glycerophosphotransferase (TagB/SpsB family)/glycosyltransferase involved in cell wall biosynthesis